MSLGLFIVNPDGSLRSDPVWISQTLHAEIALNVSTDITPVLHRMDSPNKQVEFPLDALPGLAAELELLLKTGHLKASAGAVNSFLTLVRDAMRDCRPIRAVCWMGPAGPQSDLLRQMCRRERLAGVKCSSSPAGMAESLFSQILLLSALLFFGHIMYKFDWVAGSGSLKLAFIPAFASLALWGWDRCSASPSEDVLLQKCSLSLIMVGVFTCFWLFGLKHTDSILSHPANDIGQTTITATHDFWANHVNPYTRTDINPRPELQDRHKGFHYGPGMLVAFFPAAFSPVIGYRSTGLFWTVLVLVFAGVLASRNENSIWGRANAFVFCILCVLVFDFFWNEYLRVGVNDSAPLAFVFLAFIFASGGRWGLAGLALGFSFSCKFSPAVFAMVPFLRISTPRRFFAGAAAGAFALVPFAMWSGTGLWENAFLSRFYILIDGTSVYSSWPVGAHWMIQAVFPLVSLVVLFRNYDRDADWLEMFKSFVVVMCAGIISHREIHLNHVTWLVASMAVLFSMSRDGMVCRLRILLGAAPKGGTKDLEKQPSQT